MLKHEEFEPLCALEAIGQLPPEEHARLTEHLNGCVGCRTALEEMRGLAEALPAANHSERLLSDIILPTTTREFRQDFIARARREGIRLTAQSDRRPYFASAAFGAVRRYYPAAALVVAFLVVALSFLHYEDAGTRSQARLQAAEAKTGELTREIAALRQEADAARQAAAAAEQDGGVANDKYINASKAFEKQRAEAVERIRSLEEVVASAQAREQALQQSLASAQADKGQLAQKLADGSHSLAQVNAELESARAGRATDQASLAAEKRRVEDLSERLRLQLDAAERGRELLAAGKDIRDIMGARDLHIIDVHDFDVKGKRRKSFGRIFLTEGKSLIFYAFDLGDPALKNASFQAWGQRQANDRQAVNLGVFFSDDQKQSRWVLKFDNPQVLKEIDSVFVTVEPLGGGEKPSGQKLLYAYLNTDANHP